MRTAMREYRIAAIPGDGIGGEATTEIVTQAVCDSL
jgi:isocitrate/isopropylmalate dehydrogenase